MEGRELKGTDDIAKFMFAGNARFTLVSKRTGARYTYQLRATEDDDTRFFLSVLTGADNDADYSYAALMTIPDHGASGTLTVRTTRNSRVAESAPSMVAFRWFIKTLFLSGEEGAERFFTQAEVWHEGRCGRCGRTLTVPESIERGIGPECAARLAA